MRFAMVFVIALGLVPSAVLHTAPRANEIPHLPDGRPDLSGVWTTATATPLERPPALAARTHLTPEEAALQEKSADARIDALAKSKLAYNREWLDAGLKVLPGRPTALIVDPPSGRIPWRPEAKAAFEAERARYGVGPFHSHHDLDTGERCISDGITLLPLQPYNMNFKLVQTSHYLMIYQEMYHEVRIIPFDPGTSDPRVRDQPSPSPGGQWLGDAQGRWQGNTLVVTTTNFANRLDDHWAWLWRAPRPNLRMTERFTRIDDTTTDYRVTIEDPESFSRPWTAHAPMTTDQASRGVTSGKVYEYACHEANYSLRNVLSGSAAEAAKPR